MKTSNGEKVGFVTEGYLHPASVPSGENAKFNHMPPGQDIANQDMLTVHEMPVKTVVSESYPGDGW